MGEARLIRPEGPVPYGVANEWMHGLAEHPGDALRAQRTKELRKMMKGVNRMYRERGR